MASHLIAREYRLITAHRKVASLFAARKAKFVFQDLGCPHRILRQCISDVPDWNHRRIVKRLPIPPTIGGSFIGVHEQNLATTLSECGFGAEISVRDNYIYISATDAEVLKDTIEKVSHKVKFLTDQSLSSLRVYEVQTDDDRFIHDTITRFVIGKQGHNLRRILSEFVPERIVTTEGWKTGFLQVYDESDIVNKAIEKEVENVKFHIRRRLFYTEVSTDDNPGMHNLICSEITDKEGDPIRIHCNKAQLYIKKTGVIVVSGFDLEMVKAAVEMTTQEVTRIKEEMADFFTEKVLMGNETDMYPMFYRKFIGREGENIERFRSEFGDRLHIHFDDVEGIYVSGADAEDVKNAAEMIAQEFKEFKTMLDSSFTGKVLTDEERRFHRMICGRIFGRAQKVEYILAEAEMDLVVKKDIEGFIQVYGSDAEVVEEITEEMTREVQNFRNGMGLGFTEKVLTNDDAVVHGKICGQILESEREHLNRLISETANCVRLLTKEVGVIHVYGDDAQVVKNTVERITQEVEKVTLIIGPD
ncbi:uncharacterized protein LOC110454186 [Mizuhopecten yessoensis]|uniref:K Homology domain-containing protein n=1 Tax=Mizuhopecten yessoensis TaxID=6573 RepID=A0A210QFN5_MIZYE|nr:uncharacterized protein LOC110454186 [Mizuhopecten yessoensis]OWF47567.1 hypothetical protein KP79_PYT06771 [Mizuhopecten yessoensis]